MRQLHAETVSRLSSGGTSVDLATFTKHLTQMDSFEGDTLVRAPDGRINGAEWNRFIGTFGPYPWFRD